MYRPDWGSGGGTIAGAAPDGALMYIAEPAVSSEALVYPAGRLTEASEQGVVQVGAAQGVLRDLAIRCRGGRLSRECSGIRLLWVVMQQSGFVALG